MFVSNRIVSFFRIPKGGSRMSAEVLDFPPFCGRVDKRVECKTKSENERQRWKFPESSMWGPFGCQGGVLARWRSVWTLAKVCCGGGGTNSRRKETPRLPSSGSKPGWGKRFASCGPRLSGCGWSVRFLKKLRSSSRGNRGEVRFRQGSSNDLADRD